MKAKERKSGRNLKMPAFGLRLCSMAKRRSSKNPTTEKGKLKAGRPKLKKRKRNESKEEELTSVQAAKSPDDVPEENMLVQNPNPDPASPKMIEKGERIRLSKYLFTKDRDYLLYNDGRRVKAAHFTGKTAVIQFVDLSFDYGFRCEAAPLISVYDQIHLKFPFEVVLVVVEDSDVSEKKRLKLFNRLFSWAPWTAIPYEDLDSRHQLMKKFGYDKGVGICSFIIDPKGKVLQACAENMYELYGASGYPFTDQQIESLCAEDDVAAKQPSLENLLTSSERDYLISNTGERVPVHTLKDKVVALYFFDDKKYLNDDLTKKLEVAYKQLAKGKNFEVVMIYLHDRWDSYDCANEESFREVFGRMPWLALPFKDPNCYKLLRVFELPLEFDEYKADGRLIIIGRHGEFVEVFGADILRKFGIKSYPFNRAKAVKIMAKRVKNLKLDKVWDWDPETIFRRNNGSPIKAAQLGGKRIILYFQWNWSSEAEFVERLKERYLQMKGRDDEFEVIHCYYRKEEPENVANMPWFMYPMDYGDPRLQSRISYHKDVDCCGPTLVAFDSYGRLVGKTKHCRFQGECRDFPFFSSCLEEEALEELHDWLQWDEYPY